MTGRGSGGGDVLGESINDRDGDKVGDGRRGAYVCNGNGNGGGDGKTMEDLCG